MAVIIAEKTMMTRRCKLLLDALQLTSIWRSDRTSLNRGIMMMMMIWWQWWWWWWR